MRSTMSILGLYNYDPTIFDNMVLPEGVKKDDVVNNLLMELAEFEIIYPDPEIMKSAIGFWAKKELPVWEKLNATLHFDYNPINNLYRDETITDTETRDLGETTIHKSVTTGSTQNNGTDIQKEYVSAMNETTPTLAKQTEQLLGAGNTVNGTVDNTQTATDTGTVTRQHIAHYQGSNGVLTQQMIEAERKVDEFNIINYIIDSFKTRFCLLVY